MLWNSKVVLLDEPTAALGVAQTRQVLDLVRRLADSGVGVLLISHNLTDVFEVADRITALYLGRVAADVATKDVTSRQVVELITTGHSSDLDGVPDAVRHGLTAKDRHDRTSPPSRSHRGRRRLRLRPHPVHDAR